MYVAFGGMFAQIVGYGLPNADPGLQRVLYGFLFPVALILIIFTGGELFTGNCMYMTMAYIQKKVQLRHVATNLVASYVGNFCGCVLSAYLFAYLTNMFASAPWLASIQNIAVHKTTLPWAGIFFSAFAANSLVCLSVFMGICSEDFGGKTLVMFLGIAAFATCQFEHAIANMYGLSVSLMYGTQATVGNCITHNLIPVSVGNILGGCFVALSHHFLYFFHQEIEGSIPLGNPRFTFTDARRSKLP